MNIESDAVTGAVSEAVLGGVLVWVVFALSMVASGDFGQYLAMGKILVVSVAIPVVTATFAVLVRWLV